MQGAASQKPAAKGTRPPAADATPEQRAEWGRIGGHVRAERERTRKAGIAREVLLATIVERRAFLEGLAGELKAASINEAQKANAGSAIVRALNDCDNFQQIVRENDSLRMENAALRARGGSDDGIVRLTWSDDDESPREATESGEAPVATEGETP